MNDKSVREMKTTILKLLADPTIGKQCKYNLIRPDSGSYLHTYFSGLGESYDEEDVEKADKAFEELKGNGYIRSTNTDPHTDWVVITESGKEALQNEAYDDLDSVLSSISPHLVEVRAGAWAAIDAGLPDGGRHAAASGRELINQTLKLGAPGHTTRKDRYNHLRKKIHGRTSKSELRLFERGFAFLKAQEDLLSSHTHSRSIPPIQRVRDILATSEMLLRQLLISTK